MRLDPFLNPSATLLLARAKDREEVLATLAQSAATHIETVDKTIILNGLQEREAKFPTGTPEGVAFPHVLLPQITQTLLIPCLLRPGVPWGTIAGAESTQDVIFAMFGDSERPWEHVRLLARLARIARSEGALDRLRAATSSQELHERLLTEDRAHG